MRLWIIVAFIFTIFSKSGNGQSLNSEEISFLNKEIRFLNESIHRMVIVFQVYENYNSEITKHVDLPTNEGIQNTSTHLPVNLFADNNLVIRGDSPLELYDELEGDPRRASFPINNWSLIKEAKEVIDFLSKGRKETDAVIANEDMDIFANIQTVFKEVEAAKDRYDKLRSTIKIFEKIHQNTYHDIILPKEQRQVYTALTELHYDVKKIVRQIRDDNQSGVINGVSKLQKEIGWVKTCIGQLNAMDQQSDLLSVATSIEKFIEEINNYISGKAIPAEYLPYGRGYYYHNFELLHKINQYGSGYVWKLEEFFKKYDWPVLNFLEEPHYIKLVYPELLPIELMKSDEVPSDQNIRELPSPDLPVLDNLIVNKPNDKIDKKEPGAMTEIKVEDTVVEAPYSIVHSQHVIVDSAFFEIELFDHLRRDGDRVSINVNGEWVHKKISLEEKKHVIKLEIKPTGTNYIIIRADNEGWRPPNTFGLRYHSQVDQNSVFLKKDLYTSEAIEIRFSM